MFDPIIITSSQSQSIFHITKTANISQWSIVNDGGFTSVRYRFSALEVNRTSKIKPRLKGDGREYQFRIKDDSRQYYSYITTFSTSGEWQGIEIPLGEIEPSFRGRKLNIPNFSENQIEEIVFLIANKKEERFELLLDSVVLE